MLRASFRLIADAEFKYDAPRRMDEQTNGAMEHMKLALRALSRWGTQPTLVQRVAHNENTVFRFRNGTAAEYFLRIAPPHYRPRSEIEAELDFVRHLDSRGVPVAMPVISPTGNWIETLKTDQGERYAVVFKAVYGEETKWGDEEQNRKMLFGRGKALGRLHSAARIYKPSGNFSRFHWYEDDLFSNPHQYFGKNDRVQRREYETIIQWLIRRPMTQENYGLVHGDFGSGNTLLQKDGSLIAFDFDDCLHHWYIHDLAVAIRSARAFDYAKRKRCMQYLLEGYSEEKDLTGDTAKEVGMFCRLAALYRYVTTLRESDRKRMTKKQREWFNRRLDALRHPQKWH